MKALKSLLDARKGKTAASKKLDQAKLNLHEKNLKAVKAKRGKRSLGAGGRARAIQEAQACEATLAQAAAIALRFQ